MSDADADVVVIGAGLAGLSCARDLAVRGLACVVLEASDGVGGRVRTDVIDGFRCDRGFQILLTAYPEVARQLDVADLDLQRFEPGAVVRADGAFHRVVDPRRRPGGLLSTLRAPVGSTADRLRLLRLVRHVTRAGAGDLMTEPARTTLAELEARGFGPAMIERLWRPLFGGIQLDPDLEVTSRRFALILRMLAVGEGAVPAAGMAAIPDQLAGGLGDGVVRTGTPVAAVEGMTAVSEGGDRLTGRAVVVATEGPAAAGLLGLPPVESRPAGAIWFAAAAPPLADRAVVLDGDGTGPALNLAVMSNVARTYAPAGRALVVAAVPSAAGGPGGPGDLVAPVREQLTGWFGPEVGDWVVLKVDRIAHGHPDQGPVAALKQAVDLSDGRFVCGDHRDTPSIQGALFSGRRAAAAVAASLS